jgi:hypothetical protein
MPGRQRGSDKSSKLTRNSYLMTKCICSAVIVCPMLSVIATRPGRGPLGNPRTPYMRFEDEDGVIILHPMSTDVTRAKALMWRRESPGVRTHRLLLEMHACFRFWRLG